MADGGARSSLREREPVADDLGARRKERQTNLPARRPADDDLRKYLPGVEPERRLNDWGRSERVEGFFDRTLVDFYYRYWFRAEVEGIENVPSSRRRADRLEPLGRAPAGRDDDRQGDQGGARAPAPAQHHRRALLQGLPGLQHAAAEDRRGRRPPGQRPPPAGRRGAARARLPRGPQGHREALQGPLQAAPLRPRRLRRGRDAGEDADRPRVRGRRRGGPADLRPPERAPEGHRPDLRAAHADVPALRPARDARVPARPSSASASSSRSTSTRAASTGTSRWSRRSRRRSARGSRRTSGTWSASASRSGSGRSTWTRAAY